MLECGTRNARLNIWKMQIVAMYSEIVWKNTERTNTYEMDKSSRMECFTHCLVEQPTSSFQNRRIEK